MSAISPPLLLLAILFLGSRRSLPNAAALGYFAPCAAVGVVGQRWHRWLANEGGVEMKAALHTRISMVDGPGAAEESQPKGQWGP